MENNNFYNKQCDDLALWMSEKWSIYSTSDTKEGKHLRLSVSCFGELKVENFNGQYPEVLYQGYSIAIALDHFNTNDKNFLGGHNGL